jgi:alkanesulfonate monooxygenase SsuD/methylene tetrahydromethanopterin reductase-like flavin-dependent oxidoreductase (luciferase family)
VAYGRPVTRVKEYVSIMKKIFAREGPVEHEGFHYSLPYTGEDGTGLGKSLKSILQADTSIPIYTASITPNGLAGSAEVADGVFPIWMNPANPGALRGHIEKGLTKSGRTMLDYDVAPFVTCIMGDDIEACRMPIKGNMALYIGGMGARDKNFYNDYTKALGYEDAAATIQDLYLSGRKDEAMAAVPDELVDACHLVGPAEHIKEQLKHWKTAGLNGDVGSMLIGAGQPEALELIASEML